MTPLEIGILLHYYGHADDYRNGDFSAPAVREAMNLFTQSTGMLELFGEDQTGYATYRLTDKGRFYIEYLCSIPLPVAKWTIPNEKPGTDHV